MSASDSPMGLVSTTLGLPIAAWILSMFGAKQSGVTPVTIANYQDAAQRQIQPMTLPTTPPVSYGAPALIVPTIAPVINAPTDFFTPTPYTVPQIIAGGGIPQYPSQQYAFQGSPLTSAPVYVPGLIPAVTSPTAPPVALQRAR